jgi:uncharacterized protein (TIGR02001 family)
VRVGAAIILSMFLQSRADAQVGGNVTVVSEYSFRGVSLSDRHPALQASLEYDSRDNWYAGAFASPVALPDGRRRAQLLGYAGITNALSGEMSWDAGILRSSFIGAADANYTEGYVGVSAGKLAGRLYLSPDYYGAGSRTAYVELDGAYPLSSRLQFVGHAGYLATLGEPGAVRLSDRWDARAGFVVHLDDWNVKLLLVRTREVHKPSTSDSHGYGYDSDQETGRMPVPRVLALSASRAF